MPQRFLRPGIRTSEAWNRTSFPAQGLYVSILTLVDDFGRYDGRAALLHGECFALRSDVKPQRTAALLRELHQNRLIQLYQHDGKEYLQVLRWQERSRTDTSKYPSPPEPSQDSAADGSEARPPSSSSSPPPNDHRHSTNGSAEPPVPSDEIWVKELSQSPAYQGIDVTREYAKMVVWCGAAKKMPTKRRFINWLNKCERPLSVVNFKRSGPPLDPAKINVAPEFKEWAKAKYPKRSEDIEAYRTWADVPQVLREEWKQEKIRPLTEQLASR